MQSYKKDHGTCSSSSRYFLLTRRSHLYLYRIKYGGWEGLQPFLPEYQWEQHGFIWKCQERQTSNRSCKSSEDLIVHLPEWAAAALLIYLSLAFDMTQVTRYSCSSRSTRSLTTRELCFYILSSVQLKSPYWHAWPSPWPTLYIPMTF